VNRERGNISDKGAFIACSANAGRSPAAEYLAAEYIKSQNLAIEVRVNRHPIGTPGRRVHSGFRGGYGGQVGDAGSGEDREESVGRISPRTVRERFFTPRLRVASEPVLGPREARTRGRS
jgi:hypothetical protein